MAGSRHNSAHRHSIASIKSAIKSVARFRWFIFIIGHFANVANAVVGASLSIAIVAMIESDDQVNLTSIVDTNSTNNVDVLIEPVLSKSSGKIHIDWTKVDKDRMLQASFWGTLVISAFGGRICELFGPRRVVALALTVIGLVNIAFPEMAQQSFIGSYSLRIVLGLCSGIIMPSTFVVISRWSTAYERTLSNAVVSSGGALGNLISFPLAGIMVSSSFLGGWPSVFYIFGVFNLLMAIVWYIFVYDTPEEHPRLGPEELEEILTKRSLRSGDPVAVPWSKMFTSLPVYAYLVPQFTYGWCVAVVVAQIPSFYQEVLDFSHTSNGFVASLPWLVSMGTSLIGSSAADKIRRNNRFSLTVIRKSFTFIAFGCVSIGLFLITFLDNNRIAIVITVALAKGMGTMSLAGSGSNHLDIAPSFAGTLAGFSSMLSSIASLAANEGAARIIGNDSTKQNWYRYFYLSSAINLAGVIFYCLFGSGETQTWDPSSNRRQSVRSQISAKSHKNSTLTENFDHTNQHQQDRQKDSDSHHVTLSTVSTIELEPKE